MPIRTNSATFSSEKDKNDSSSQDNHPKEIHRASIFDYLSKGPHIPEQMPPKEPREEIEARMYELNKRLGY